MSIFIDIIERSLVIKLKNLKHILFFFDSEIPLLRTYLKDIREHQYIHNCLCMYKDNFHNYMIEKMENKEK